MSVRSILVAACLLASQFALAQPADPLWLRARAAMLASRDLVAGEISAHTVVTDGAGKNLDTVDKATRLSGWEGTEPIRTTVRLTEATKSGLGELKFEWGVANHPDQALATGDSVLRAGSATLDGKPYALFHVSGKNGKLPFQSTVWIDEEASLPVRADYVVSGIPMARSMNYSVRFGRDEQARWLPLTVNVDAVISALFFKFQVRSTQRLSAWVKRP